MLHKVSIAGLTVDPASNTPIIILKSEDNDQTVPIWIGLLEATAIASALQGVTFDRPMTHDLFKNFSDMLNIAVSKVLVWTPVQAMQLQLHCDLMHRFLLMIK